MPSDFIIKNALIIDGSGIPSFTGDVAVAGGKITAIGKNLPSTGKNTVDAKGYILSPGFIDTHGHSDVSVIASPEATGKISQGVTTEISGNCGLSVFPVTRHNREHLQELYKNYDVKISWRDADDYSILLDKVQPSINVSSLCGHNTLRAAVMGYGDLKPSSIQLNNMKTLLGISICNGAAGLSSGLIYVPGIFSGKNEIVLLLEELAKTNKPYTTHLRSEGALLLESIDEAVDAVMKSGQKKLHISHLKTAGSGNWHKIDDVFQKISQAHHNGIHLTADRYPYTESMTQLSCYMPAPYDRMDDIKFHEHVQNPAKFAEFTETLKRMPEERWKTLRIISSTAEFAEKGFGKTFADFASMSGMNPWDICAAILKEDTAGATAASAGMSEENMSRILSQDYVACGSDETARPLDYSLGRSHPRGFGSFPRYINVLRKNMSLEKIIRKVTSLPADIYNLHERGRIVVENAADLVLLNPDKLSDTANFADPHRISEGILKVWVNGVLTWEDGALTGKRAGKYLRPGFIK
jgi:N-acyl-D-amino-acid deacylase